MSVLFRILAGLLLAVVLGLFATGIERYVWMFSGSGTYVLVPKDIYRQTDEVQCEKPFIEVKHEVGGALRYRCGTYWLLSRTEHSTALNERWPAIERELAGARK